MLIIVEEEGSVMELTVVPSLSSLEIPLLLSQRPLEENASWDSEDSPKLPGGNDSRSANVCEITLIDIDHVCQGESTSNEGIGLEYSFSVVHSIDDSLILLPLIFIL